MISRYRILWGFGNRLWLELIFVLTIIGILIYLQTRIGLNSIISAELAEPVGLARDMQFRMMLQSAITGEWPTEEEFDIYHDDFSRIIKAYYPNQDGHLLLRLHSKKKELNNKWMAFNLYEQDAGQGYKIYIWRCGEVVMPAPYSTKRPLQTTVDPIFTNTVCRY